MAKDNSPVLLTRREAAKRAGVSYSAIVLWERNGLLEVTRKDDNVLIPQEQVDAIIQTRQEREAGRVARGPYVLIPEGLWERLRDHDQVIEGLARSMEDQARQFRERFEQSKADRERLIADIAESIRVAAPG